MKIINFGDTEPVLIPVSDPFPEPHTLPIGWELSGLLQDQDMPSSIHEKVLDVVSIEA